MKGVIVSEIERLLMRANIGERAQYSSVILLSQIVFAPHEGPLASHLVSLYLALFSQRKLDAAGLDSRLLSALLTGLNRSFPCAARVSTTDNAFDTHADRLFRLARAPNFNAAIQALTLL